MKAASAQPFHVESICILKSHGCYSKAMCPDTVKKSIKVDKPVIVKVLLCALCGSAPPSSGYKVSALKMLCAVGLAAGIGLIFWCKLHQAFG